MIKNNEQVEAIYALTARDIKKLRDAETISFHRSPDSSGITASKKRYQPSGTERLWEHEISAASTVKDGGWASNQEDFVKIAYCHYMLWHTNNVHETWYTIARLLRAGDRLELEWRRDSYTNGYLEKAKLHGDRLKLIIHRGQDKKLVFEVGVSICEDNTARLIRRGPYNNQ